MNALCPVRAGEAILRSVKAGYKFGAQPCTRRRLIRRVMRNLHERSSCPGWVRLQISNSFRHAARDFDAAFQCQSTPAFALRASASAHRRTGRGGQAAIIPRSVRRVTARHRMNSGICSGVCSERWIFQSAMHEASRLYVPPSHSPLKVGEEHSQTLSMSWRKIRRPTRSALSCASPRTPAPAGRIPRC